MSDWKAESNRRRDVRQDKPLDEPVRVPPVKKDTKRWCKGHVGVEHQTKCMTYAEKRLGALLSKFSSRWRLLVCVVCGKELARYYGCRDQGPGTKPAWVDR